MKKTSFSIVIILFLFISCNYHNSLTHIYPGEVEIISMEIDSSLNDSAMIYGTVYDNQGLPLFRPLTFKIYTNNNKFCTHTDTAYHFQLKLTADKYTIICEDIEEDDRRHICVLNNLLIQHNQKIKIKFSYGETAY